MKKSILLVAIAFIAFSSVAVFAETNGSSNGGSSVTTTGQQGANSQKCTDVTGKVTLVTERYSQNKNKYMNAFQNMYENMNSLMLKLKSDGYDTTKLETDLSQFNNMIQNASRYYNAFEYRLDNSKKGVCGNSDADSGQEFTRAREQLSLCKNEMLNLRTFAEETLKLDLLALKDQVSE